MASSAVQKQIYNTVIQYVYVIFGIIIFIVLQTSVQFDSLASDLQKTVENNTARQHLSKDISPSCARTATWFLCGVAFFPGRVFSRRASHNFSKDIRPDVYLYTGLIFHILQNKGCCRPDVFLYIGVIYHILENQGCNPKKYR
jgi:hypothetical protein